MTVIWLTDTYRGSKSKKGHGKNVDYSTHTHRTDPLPNTKVDESLLADILVKKFADHLPLYRQSEMLAREGIQISRQLHSQWVVKYSLALKPLYDTMLKLVLESNNVFVDEVPVDMLSPGKRSVG